MSRVTSLLQLIVAEVKTEAIRQGIEQQVHNKDIARLVRAPANTLCAWMKGGSSNRQFAALLTFLDYLPPEKVVEIFRFTLQRKSLKRDFEDLRDPQAISPKASKKKKIPQFRLGVK